MNHKAMIEQAANRFYMEFESGFQSGNPFDTSQFKGLLPGTLNDWKEGEDQMMFLRALESKLNAEKLNHLANHHHGEDTNCPETNFYNELLYFTNQTINRLNLDSKTSSDFFSTDEKIDFHSKIDEVLKRINELQSGQEVIYNEIDDLKTKLNLDKKTFLHVVKGKIFDMAIGHAIDSGNLTWIYEKLTGEVGPRLLS